jgi:hypothetical protein
MERSDQYNFSVSDYIGGIMEEELNGRYIPTITLVSGFAGGFANPLFYEKKGDHVHVWGQIGLLKKSSGASTSILTLTLPFASALSNSHELSGNCGMHLFYTRFGVIYGEVATGLAVCNLLSDDSSGDDLETMYLDFSYILL